MKQTTDADRYLSLADAADYLGVSRSTMYRLAWTGKVQCLRIGRLLKFRRAELDAAVTRSAA